jgi:hypothetical protein
MKRIRKHTLIIILSLCIIATSAIAGQQDKIYGDAVVSEITSIYDGDTFR